MLAAAIAFDVMAASGAGPAQIAERQSQRLAALLQAARATRFYRDLLRGLDTQRLPLTEVNAALLQSVVELHGPDVDPAAVIAAIRAEAYA